MVVSHAESSRAFAPKFPLRQRLLFDTPQVILLVRSRPVIDGGGAGASEAGAVLSELETIKTIIARAFFIPVSSIADDADISEIKGMDSLTFEALMLEIEQVSGQEPDPVALMDVRTVADLAGLIEEMKAAAQRA